jgi:LysM repeat protein
MYSSWSRRLLMVLLAVLLAGGALVAFPHTSAAAPEPAPLADGYVVKAGDTLNAIAARYGVSTSALARANGIRNINRIYIGQRLAIPGRTVSSAPATGGSSATATGGVYIVQRGDTLSRIAARNGTTVRALMAINNIANPDRIWVGQRIAIAKGAAGAPAASKPSTSTGATTGRWIDINLSQQRLTAYQGNTPVFSTLISGGLPRTPTVVGRFRIQTKLTSTRMSGPGYNLPGVPYTMYFYKGYAIHGTYWHNNFGRPMSHGCVNMRTPDAAWLFKWASIGTLVVTHY